MLCSQLDLPRLGSTNLCSLSTNGSQGVAMTAASYHLFLCVCANTFCYVLLIQVSLRPFLPLLILFVPVRSLERLNWRTTQFCIPWWYVTEPFCWRPPLTCYSAATFSLLLCQVSVFWKLKQALSITWLSTCWIFCTHRWKGLIRRIDSLIEVGADNITFVNHYHHHPRSLHLIVHAVHVGYILLFYSHYYSFSYSILFSVRFVTLYWS